MSRHEIHCTEIDHCNFINYILDYRVFFDGSKN